MSLKVLDEMVYPVIVAVSVITTFLTPIMIKSANPFYGFILRILPHKWREYVEKNETAVRTTQTEEKLWSELFKNYLIRMVLFSMILSTIIFLSMSLIQPLVLRFSPNLSGRIIVTAVTLLMMAPFLKALIGWEAILPQFLRSSVKWMFYRLLPKKVHTDENSSMVKKIEEKFDFCSGWSEGAENVKNFFISNSVLARIYYKLWIAKKSNRLPLIMMTSFRLLVVAFFIVTVVHLFLTENYKVTLALLFASVVFLAQSRWLLNQYMKMEAQFLANLHGHRTSKEETK